MQQQSIVWHHLVMSLGSALQQTNCDVSRQGGWCAGRQLSVPLFSNRAVIPSSFSKGKQLFPSKGRELLGSLRE